MRPQIPRSLEQELIKDVAIAYLNAKKDYDAFVKQVQSKSKEQISRVVWGMKTKDIRYAAISAIAVGSNQVISQKVAEHMSRDLLKLSKELDKISTSLQTSKQQKSKLVENHIVKPPSRKAATKRRAATKKTAEKIADKTTRIIEKYSKSGRDVIGGAGTGFQDEFTAIVKRWLMVRFWEEEARVLANIATRHAQASTRYVRNIITQHTDTGRLSTDLARLYSTEPAIGVTSSRGPINRTKGGYKANFGRYLYYGNESASGIEEIDREDSGMSVSTVKQVRQEGKDIYGTMWIGLKFGDIAKLNKVKAVAFKGKEGKEVEYPFWLILEFGTFQKFAFELSDKKAHMAPDTRAFIYDKIKRRKRKSDYFPVRFNRGGQAVWRMVKIGKTYPGLRAIGEHSDISSRGLFEKDRWIKRPRKGAKNVVYKGMQGIHFISKGFNAAMPVFKADIRSEIEAWKQRMAAEVAELAKRYYSGDTSVLDTFGVDIQNRRMIQNIHTYYSKKRPNVWVVSR